jgi:hypothetical protein
MERAHREECEEVEEDDEEEKESDVEKRNHLNS